MAPSKKEADEAKRKQEEEAAVAEAKRQAQALKQKKRAQTRRMVVIGVVGVYLALRNDLLPGVGKLFKALSPGGVMPRSPPSVVPAGRGDPCEAGAPEEAITASSGWAVEPEPRGAGPRVLVVTHVPPGPINGTGVAWSVAANAAWAKKKGYGFAVHDDTELDGRPHVFAKLRLLHWHVSTYQYDWVFWLDPDTVVADHNFGVEQPAGRMPTSKHVAVCAGVTGARVNTGAMLVRGSEQAAALLDKWWDAGEDMKGPMMRTAYRDDREGWTGYMDLAAFEAMWAESQEGEWRSLVKIAEPTAFNSGFPYWSEAGPVLHLSDEPATLREHLLAGARKLVCEGKAVKPLYLKIAALEGYKAAIEADDLAALSHFHLGVLLAELKKPRDAEEHLRAAIGLMPEMPQGYSMLGSMLMQEKRYDEAYDTYDELAGVEPDSPAPVQRQAVVRMMQEDYERALSRATAAIEYDDRVANMWGIGCIALHKLDRADEAGSWCREAVRLDYKSKGSLEAAIGKPISGSAEE